ncbi:SDR family NAD(P)-dependent oxidoreductase [Paenibacillus sp. S150]|uniref:SDR family NAD(P)-dependent oxidoreductase n=1 Tax=Paenibacillus sp. S150 TaxID=2749826 RepID=UPI001C57B2F3|nr:SDR family NAD(P)-dependent oxidoreductase [Paenibacillus sp. S150]MBW4084438.1 SDR family NAD(P)-dependent oxidoreductase [Paenibacillus sp. S150]
METKDIVKQALIEIKRLKNEKTAPIAIIGMACRFPNGINTPEQYWEALINKQDCIGPIPQDRWNVEDFYSSNHADPGKMYIKEGGFVHQIDRFDADLFKLPEREIKYMDPQQRILLEVAWECLERSGIDPLQLRGTKTGVYLGICTSDYALHSIYSRQPEQIDIYSFTGSAHSIASGRLSYMLGLEGPSMSIDTACSSSLVALHEACASLRSGQSEMAIVGGVNLMISPEHTVQFCKVNALSTASRCKTFDADADGYVRSEGCGVVLLKRLDQAVKDKDAILSVIRGTAINNDGTSSSLTAPNGVAQQRLLKEALKNANLHPHEIGYVEAHGTGTPLGDPIEVNALGHVYGADRSEPLWIGSAKTNIGHLEAAAGIAGLIKSVLAIQHSQIPPNLHYNRPNPEIMWNEFNIRVPEQAENWPEGKKRAAVSAFGFSGTNAHVIIEEPPVTAAADWENSIPLLTLSAQSKTALIEKIKRMAQFINGQKESAMYDICYTAAVCRPHLAYRKAYVLRNRTELLELLDWSIKDVGETPAIVPKIGFSLPDSLNWNEQVVRQMFKGNLVFENAITDCLGELQLGSMEELSIKTQQPLRHFIFQYAVVAALLQAGIRPEWMTADRRGWLAVFAVSQVLTIRECLIWLMETSAKELPLELLANRIASSPISFVTAEGKVLDELAIREGSYWRAVQPPAIERTDAVILQFDPIGSRSGSQTFIWDVMDSAALPRSLAFFYEKGVTLQWHSVFHEIHTPLLLPTTPFIGKRYWVEKPIAVPRTAAPKSFFQHKLPIHGKKSMCYVFRIEAKRHRFVADHGFLGQRVLSATSFLDMMTAVGEDLYGSYRFDLCHLSYEQPLIWTGEDVDLHIYLESTDDRSGKLSVLSFHSNDHSETSWVQHVTASVVLRTAVELEGRSLPEQSCNELLSVARELFYKRLNEYGYYFATLHQGMEVLHVSQTRAIAKVKLPQLLEKEAADHSFHPALLDACTQVFLAFLPEPGEDGDNINITMGTEKYILYRQPDVELEVVAEIAEQSAQGFTGNMFIYNRNQELVAEIKGYMTKRVNKKTLQSSLNKRDQSFYEEIWVPKAHEKGCFSQEEGMYLLWADDSLFTSYVAEQFSSKGCSTLLVCRGNQFRKLADQKYEIDPFESQHYSRLVQELREQQGLKISGSLYMWGLDQPFSPISRMVWEEIKTVGTTLLHISQQMYGRGSELGSFTFLTQNANRIQSGDYWVNPVSAAAVGFLKVMRLEYPQIRCAGIDLQNLSRSSSLQVVTEIVDRTDDTLIAYRDTQRYVPRLKERGSTVEESPDESMFREPFALQSKGKGSIEELYYGQAERVIPGDEDIELEVMVAGFNFHDIIHALNLMERHTERFGLDCVGRIIRKGKHVTDLSVGDLVVAFAPGCFGKFVVVPRDYVAVKPHSLNINEAATVPSAYLTGYSIMERLAASVNVKSVLIHAATGGLGIALVQLAHRMGITVYATASSNKHFLLRQLGVRHIFDSRSTDYAEQLMIATDGKGVDAAINSFTGEHVAKTFSVVRSGGSFVEVGERERLTDEQAAEYRNDVTYIPFSLFDSIHRKPGLVMETLTMLNTWFDEGVIRPLPYQVYDKADIKEAFRYIQKGKHVGKVLVRFSEPQSGEDMSKTVVIAGGSGGIGWEIVRNWPEASKDTLVLLGRSKEPEALRAKLEQLRTQGRHVMYYSVDIGDSEALGIVLAEVNAQLPPLRGIIHTAGILSDRLIHNEEWDNMQTILHPKIQGAWNLHCATLDKELEFFILFSSVTAVMGSIGVAGYATGNAFMSGLTAYRKQLGLPSLCLNWGPWQEVGMLTRLNPVAQEIWTKNGFKTLSSKEGLQSFEAVRKQNGEVSIMPVDWEKWLKQYPKGRIPDTLLSVEKLGGRNLLRTPEAGTELAPLNGGIAACSSNTSQAAYEQLASLLKRVLQRPVTAEEFKNFSFQEMGLDSLMSVEFRNLLNECYGSAFPISLLYSYPDLRSLHRYICDEVLQLAAEKETRELQAEIPSQALAHSEDKNLSLDFLRERLDLKLKLYDSTIS